jgi:bleomycin hydrolase
MKRAPACVLRSFFFDKVERANMFLESVIATASEDVESRLVQHLLETPLMDGGQWDMVVNVVAKYGIVPKSVYPESHSSSSSAVLNGYIKSRLREFARTLRDMHAAGASSEELQSRKDAMVDIITRACVVHLGRPPEEFDWAYYNKSGKHSRTVGLTPLSFYRDVVGVDVNDFVSLVNDPRNR